MRYRYIHLDEAEQFVFYRVPKALFTEKEFEKLSIGAKLVYGILLDRVGLSKLNGWVDEKGYVYIVYTVKELGKVLQISPTTAKKYLHELDTEHGIGLIERYIQGQNKPAIIYVKYFEEGNCFRENHVSESGSKESEYPETQKLVVRTNNNYYSGQSKTAYQDKQNLLGNDTEINDTDKNYIEGSETVRMYQNNHCKRYGRFGNVILSEDEYWELRAMYPGYYEEMIENLSSYMASTEKKYQNHFATLCLWEERDRVRKKDEDYYAFEEGECL